MDVSLLDRDAPALRTERTELWLPTKNDLAGLVELLSNPRTARFLGPSSGFAHHFARFCRNAGSWQLYGYGSFIVRSRDSGELIGNCGVFHSWRGLGEDFDDHPEVGWILRHDQVGRGLAREIMHTALGWFDREHGARRIVCMIEQGNQPSTRLALHLGFQPLREAVPYEDTRVDLFARPPGTPLPPL